MRVKKRGAWTAIAARRQASAIAGRVPRPASQCALTEWMPAHVEGWLAREQALDNRVQALDLQAVPIRSAWVAMCFFIFDHIST
jgi:hypothetical protein